MLPVPKTLNFVAALAPSRYKIEKHMLQHDNDIEYDNNTNNENHGHDDDDNATTRHDTTRHDIPQPYQTKYLEQI